MKENLEQMVAFFYAIPSYKSSVFCEFRIMKKIIKRIFICMLIFISLSNSVYAQDIKYAGEVRVFNTYPLFNEKFYNYVYQLKNDIGSTEACIAYKDSASRKFIITARHFYLRSFTKVVGKDTIYYDSVPYKSGDKVFTSYFYKGEWVRKEMPVYFYADCIDIAVVKADDIEASDIFVLDYVGMILSADVFILGYPLNYATKEVSSFSTHPIAFVNKGIFSGSEDSAKRFYLSADNTYGYSGGPILYYNYEHQRWQVGGIVSDFVNQTNKIKFPNGTSGYYFEKSGLMRAYNIKYAVDIIRKIH